MRCPVSLKVEKNQTVNNRIKNKVIMCGDYNSLPESGVAEFIQKGKVCLNHHEFRKLQYNRKLTKMNPKNGEVLKNCF